MFVFLHIDMILMEAAALVPGPLASPSHTPMHASISCRCSYSRAACWPACGRLGSGKGLCQCPVQG